MLLLLVHSLLIVTASGFQTNSGASRRPETHLNSIPNPVDTFTSGLASICRLPKGVTVDTILSSSPDSLTVFGVENDTGSRAVRERLTELDLNFRFVPASKGSRAITDKNYKYALPGGDTKIPALLINDDRMINGASDVMGFLESTYGSAPSFSTGDGDGSFVDQAKNVAYALGNTAAGLLRIGRGSQISPAAATDKSPKQPLVLYNYEGNQFCRLVREVLTELDLVHDVKSVGKNSPRRKELTELTGGSTQCPYLVDTNTNEAISDSAEIVEYLYKMYGKFAPPNEILQFASDKILPLVRPLFSKLTVTQAEFMMADKGNYEGEMTQARKEIANEVKQAPVVVYTYALSPFSVETKSLLDRTGVEWKEISLGNEWLPGLIGDKGSEKRAALLESTGQSSLPHIFVNGESIGGLFDGEPGLVPSLGDGSFLKLLERGKGKSKKSKSKSFRMPLGAFE